MNKKLIIINGVTGFIGSNIFTYFIEKDDFIIFGISRKGKYVDTYIDENTGKLPPKHLVFSLTDYYRDGYEADIKLFLDILPNEIEEVVFINSMGEYKTEMDIDGNIIIEDDNDQDGINDVTKRMTHDVPMSFVNNFCKIKNKKFLFYK